MNLKLQIISLVFSFVYGILICFLLEIFDKIIFNNKIYVKLIFSLVFSIVISIIYFIVMLYINNAILHYYFFLMVLFGYLFMRFLYTKLFVK